MSEVLNNQKTYTNASGETSYFPNYIQQQNRKHKIIKNYQSLVFYSGPENFIDFQEISFEIIKELLQFYKQNTKPNTPFVTLSPWTCYINKTNQSNDQKILLKQDQLFLIEQINQNIYTTSSKPILCRYLAPELIIDVFEPTIKSDIFSLGCLLLMLFDNSVQDIGWLFKQIYTEEDYIYYVRDKLPRLEPLHKNYNNSVCWNYLKKMASFNPEDRPTLEEIITNNPIFPKNSQKIELQKIPNFQFKYYYKPWNGNQFDDNYDLGKPHQDIQSKTQYFLGQQKFLKTDVTIFKGSIAHIKYNSLKFILPNYDIVKNYGLIISRTIANYVDEKEYKNDQKIKEKETFEVNLRFNQFKFITQRQKTLFIFQFIFLRCILEEQKLFLTDNAKFTFKFDHLLIAGPQFITCEEQENDFILQQLSKVEIDNQRIKDVIQQLMNNSISNQLALIMVGKEFDEIVVNRDYFNNIIKRNGVQKSIKEKLEDILNYYHPKFMRRDLNILLRNLKKDIQCKFDSQYLKQLRQKCKN